MRRFPRTRFGFPRQPAPAFRQGFTLLEIVLVLACLAVAAMLVLPDLSSGNATQLRSAATQVLADIEYAQGQSLHSSDPPVVKFDVAQNAYWIAPKSDPTKPINHPVDKTPYINRFGSGRLGTLKLVKLQSCSLSGGGPLEFGPLGQVKSASAVEIVLRCSRQTIKITIDATTGESTIGQIETN